MNPILLLIGFRDLSQILSIDKTASVFQAETVPVSSRDYNQRLEVLAGLDAGVPVSAYAGPPLGQPLLVLCGLERRLDPLLDALRDAGVSCRKAVLTPANRRWNVLQLDQALRTEQQSLQKGGNRS